jgi:hypothetical protein
MPIKKTWPPVHTYCNMGPAIACDPYKPRALKKDPEAFLRDKFSSLCFDYGGKITSSAGSDAFGALADQLCGRPAGASAMA